MAKRKKPKIKVKSVHALPLHEHITNPIPIKNKEFKKKKKKNLLKYKRQKNDYEKVLRFKKEVNFSDEEIVYDEENQKEENTFLDFDDDIHIEKGHEEDEQINYNKYTNFSYDETNDCVDIFKEYDIPIEEEIKKTQKSNAEKSEQVDENLAIVEKCYAYIGEQLAIYTNGKIHSAFIILTRSPKWYELILLTKPEKWSKYATFEATKIFSTGLKESEVPKFYELILLPIILKHIEEHKKLDGVLYQTLIKALYKPIAWFKGILFPLIRQRCSNKVMVIIGSIIKRMSINVKYVMIGVKLMFSLKGEDSVLFYFLSIIFDKKYKFTKDFIEESTKYFEEFSSSKKALPLVWHKSLLLFVQNYKDSLSDEQRRRLQNLVTRKHHHKVSIEILKILFTASVVTNKIKDLNVPDENIENSIV